MDNQRLFLWAALAFVYFMVYQAWVQDHRPPPAPAATTPTTAAPGQANQPLDTPPDLPALPSAAPAAAPDAPQLQASPAVPAEQRIHVRTDVLDLAIDTLGGDIRRVDLPRYPRRKDQPDIKVRLLSDKPEELFLIQSGLRTAGGGDEPNHLARYSTDRTEYALADDDDMLSVHLAWQGDNGISVTKSYTFRRGSYAIDVAYEVANQGTQAWNAAPYLQLKRRNVPVKRSMTNVDSYSFRGPVYYDGEKYEKIKIDDLEEEPVNEEQTGGWVASIQHHFLAAAIPAGDRPFRFQSRVTNGDTYTLSAIGPLEALEPGATKRVTQQLFVGPKLQKQLKATAPGLRLTVDYGFLTILSQPLFAVLAWIHGYVGNWGWAIILLTILVKLAFYKLTETSGRSMAKMRKLQPRIKALQERYKDDKPALSQAMLEMYRKEGANPAAGCLPILIQMPVFLALYWVLLESVEMRQAPFALWIQDLSVRDPYFILPFLMAAAMFMQQRLSPAPPDPVQAKVMMFLPVMMSVFFAFFPAGLVLYWFVNTLLSVLQQWRINKVIEAKG